jgi:hypothetical protein
LPKVVITQGPGSGTEYDVGRAVILGRLDTNDIPVADKKASREHAKIYQQGQQYAIVDLNSSNGTFVNGDPVTKRVLQPGDEISIGMVTMRFEDPDAEAAKQAVLQKRKSLDDDFGARTKAADAKGEAPEIVLKSHQPLQFRKVQPGRTLIGFDLDQVSDGARMAIYAALIVIFAVLIWLSYSLVA